MRSNRRHRWGHRLLGLLLGVFVVIGGVIGYFVWTTKTAADRTYAPVTTQAAINSDLTGKKPLSILLLGTDTGAFGRDEVRGNTDTIMVATINPTDQRTTLTSIPRDTLAAIQGVDNGGVQKINAAYALGGAKAAMATVGKLLNVPLDYYVTVNMAGLAKIVDAVGGVDVNVPFTWDDANTGDQHFDKGPAHLNGERALAYARMRYEDPEGDYGRQKRQQEVIGSLVKKLLSAKTLTHYSSILDSLSDSVRTSLQFNDMLALAQHYRQAAGNIEQGTLKGTGAFVNGGAYEIPATETLQATSDKLRQELGLDKVTLANYNVQENAANQTLGFDFASSYQQDYQLTIQQ